MRSLARQHFHLSNSCAVYFAKAADTHEVILLSNSPHPPPSRRSTRLLLHRRNRTTLSSAPFRSLAHRVQVCFDIDFWPWNMFISPDLRMKKWTCYSKGWKEFKLLYSFQVLDSCPTRWYLPLRRYHSQLPHPPHRRRVLSVPRGLKINYLPYHASKILPTLGWLLAQLCVIFMTH